MNRATPEARGCDEKGEARTRHRTEATTEKHSSMMVTATVAHVYTHTHLSIGSAPSLWHSRVDLRGIGARVWPSLSRFPSVGGSNGEDHSPAREDGHNADASGVGEPLGWGGGEDGKVPFAAAKVEAHTRQKGTPSHAGAGSRERSTHVSARAFTSSSMPVFHRPFLRTFTLSHARPAAQ